MSRWITLLLPPLLAAAAAGAGEPLKLDQAIATALESSPAVRAAQAAADAAASRLEQARGARLPRLDLVEAFTWTDQPASVFALELNQERFNFDTFVQSDPNQPDFLETWSTHLEVTLPLYTGGQLSARIGQVRHAATAEENDWRWAQESTAWEVASAFIELAKARDFLALLETARATTARHVELARSYAGQGMILESEVLKAEVQLAEVDEHLARARTGASLAEAALNFRMGVEQATPRQLAPPPPPPPADDTLESRLEAAIVQRPDLQAARARLEAGRLEEGVARSALLPEVGLRGSYELFDDVPFGANGGSATVFAYARLNLFRGGSDVAGIEAARHTILSFEENIRRFEDGIRLEVRQAWQELSSARARQATAEHALTAAHEAHRVTEQRFRQGLERMIDLLDAETSLREAETRDLTARYDVLIQTYRLRHAAGDSLITSQVEVPE